MSSKTNSTTCRKGEVSKIFDHAKVKDFGNSMTAARLNVAHHCYFSISKCSKSAPSYQRETAYEQWMWTL